MDPRTIFPVLPRLLCCLPARYRQRLCCGVRFPTQVSTSQRDGGALGGKRGGGGEGPCAWRCPPPPAVCPQDAPHPSPTAEKRVPNGVGAVPRDEAEEQGYGPPAYALQETAF